MACGKKHNFLSFTKVQSVDIEKLFQTFIDLNGKIQIFYRILSNESFCWCKYQKCFFKTKKKMSWLWPFHEFCVIPIKIHRHCFAKTKHSFLFGNKFPRIQSKIPERIPINQSVIHWNQFTKKKTLTKRWHTSPMKIDLWNWENQNKLDCNTRCCSETVNTLLPK